jgi:hypothetical protein
MKQKEEAAETEALTLEPGGAFLKFPTEAQRPGAYNSAHGVPRQPCYLVARQRAVPQLSVRSQSFAVDGELTLHSSGIAVRPHWRIRSAARNKEAPADGSPGLSC